MRERFSTAFNDSTLIGQRDRVAFEFERTRWPDGYESWIYGYMCLWAGGERIGKHDEEVAMTVALASFPNFLKHTGKRIDRELMAMPKERAFTTLYGALYQGDDLTDEEIDELSERYRHFEISDGGFDYYDGWKAFLIEDKLVGRIIWRKPDGTIHEARVGAGEFDRVVDGFLTALEKTSGMTRRAPQEPR